MKFTIHARQRMKQRGITEQEVHEALNNLHLEYPSRTNPNCQVGHGTTSAGRELKIVVDVSDPNILTMVTVAPIRM